MQLNRAVCLDLPDINLPWFHQKFIEDIISRGKSLLIKSCISNLEIFPFATWKLYDNKTSHRFGDIAIGLHLIPCQIFPANFVMTPT